MSAPLLPLPSIPITVRPATIADLPFIDALQKKHRNQLGFLKTAALTGKIEKGEVLIAEESVVRSPLSVDLADRSQATDHGLLTTDCRLGYLIGSDRYFKHDDIGIIYQLNVEPGRQRGLIGATLLKEMFHRAAYGCKLFCCWCAQDLAANRFWEAMGFVPLAVRAGSEKRRRNHIFWQKRIRQGDTKTQWWFPCETTGGQMSAARLALPIPPGVHWSEVEGFTPAAKSEVRRLKSEVKTPSSLILPPSSLTIKPIAVTKSSGLKFGAAAPVVEIVEKPAKEPRACPERSRGEKKPKVTSPEPRRRKNDPKLVAAARELRDRWLEQLNSDEAEHLLPQAKYEVARLNAVRAARTAALAAKPVKLIRHAA